MSMTSRERVLATVNHREPDRVPLDLGGTAQPASTSKPTLACGGPGVSGRCSQSR